MNQHYAPFFYFFLTTPVHVSGSFLAHHQEVKRIKWPGTSFTFKRLYVGILSQASKTVGLKVK
jgi:hypothetical protein